MPIQLVSPGQGGGKQRELPSFFFQGLKDQKSQLNRFLKLVEKKAINYETEDPESGWKYINAEKDKADVNKLIEYGSDKTLALIELAREEDFNQKEILDILFNAAYIEPSSGEGGENYLMHVEVDPELEIDLHQFKGRINKKTVKNLYSGLVKGLDEEDFSNIEDGKLVLDLAPTSWSVFVDEEKLMEEWMQKLDMGKEEIIERKPAVASLKDRIIATLRKVV